MGSLKTRVTKLETAAGTGATSVEEAVLRAGKMQAEEGAAFKAWREKRGYSEEEAAKALGVEHDPLRPYAYGSYRSMESGEGTTNSIRAMIGVKPIEPWSAEGQIGFHNRMREHHISLGIDASPLSAEEEEAIRSGYAKEMREYDTAMKLWEENNDGKH